MSQTKGLKAHTISKGEGDVAADRIMENEQNEHQKDHNTPIIFNVSNIFTNYFTRSFE